MRYFARIGHNEYEIEIDGGTVLVDGEPVDLDLQRMGDPELYSLLCNGRSYELLVEEDRYRYGVTLRGDRYDVLVEDERQRRLNAGRRLSMLPDGELAVVAPIPGLVVKVLVDVGDVVEEGQALVLLEAMKMENEIRARRGGTISKIQVQPGQRVEQNGILLVME